jgi:hypothetical protein
MKQWQWWYFFGCVLLGLALTGCRSVTPTNSLSQQPAAVTVTTSPLTTPFSCSDTFITHALDHTTTTSTRPASLYESNGAGVAINDLDNDGDQEIVLANLGAPSTIFWNEGGLRFRTERIAVDRARAVNIVDVDGDGWQDLVFTRRLDKPVYWRNSGQAGPDRFVAGVLPDVNNPFYSMNWGDLDGNGTLDLVAASYDTELRKERGAIFDYQGGGVGVLLYRQQNGAFQSERLDKEADALTIALPDLNNDGWLDILVGNDFNRPDGIWLRTDDGWVADQPFRTTTENTMSFDLGDIDNNGTQEIFATDMKPISQEIEILAAWLPVMNKMTRPASSADPQFVENVLQMRGADGRFDNRAYERVIDATGWSWSSKFGDLDNDGFLDIYVVNGMIDAGLLGHLPNNELVEPNLAFQNDGRGYFTPVPQWGLGSTASGRGMSMADLDGDGDLDIVVNNLLSPAQLFENQLCGGVGVAVDLRWPASPNPYAIGARLTLTASTGVYHRDVRAASGYLSGDPARVHFGLPATAQLQALIVQWPDGAQSVVTAIASQTLTTVQRE